MPEEHSEQHPPKAKKKRRPGRPRLFKGGTKQTMVSMDDDTRRILERLGHGNLSEGVRRAVRIAIGKEDGPGESL